VWELPHAISALGSLQQLPALPRDAWAAIRTRLQGGLAPKILKRHRAQFAVAHGMLD
jgi:hypothetical protein